MVYSKAPDFVLNNICFFPKSGRTQSGQLADCYRQFDESSINKGFSRNSILKQTIFISAGSNSEYYQSKQKLLACAKEFFDELPPTSIIAQSPDNGLLVLEIVCIEGINPNELFRKSNGEASWTVIQRGEIKMLVAADLCETTETNDILLQSNTSFQKLQYILDEERMEFSDIIRQWNYIEQITATVEYNNSKSQHYQIFNDVRSKFYHQSDFRNGYPAATGIGMDCGGIIIDFIAIKFGNEGSVIPVKSSVQLDAYTYSKEVLGNNNSMGDFCRTTPKFERAKIIITPENKWIFISGTAAITGELSTAEQTVVYQTEMTIQNILSLISIENLQKHGISISEKANINYLRVYVKYSKDMKQVQETCQKYFPHIPIAFIVADICRPELLVEIEGHAVIN